MTEEPKEQTSNEPIKRRGLCRRVHLKRWDEDGFLYVTDNEQREFIVARPTQQCYNSLNKILKVGVQLNLLNWATDDREVVHPENIIFDPDFLIEITSLCSCMQEHGSSPLNYVLNLFKESKATRHTLLGEAANMFLDDCVNERTDKTVSYNDSMKKFFREYPLQLTTAEGIDTKFFDETKRQFTNIRQTVGRLFASINNDTPDNIYIEPSFFCPALGLQGRFDLLEGGTNNIIELKSGKADEYRKGAKEEHILQMSLYKEILKYNLSLPDDSVHAHLFYSRYPSIIHRECNKEQIARALMLRNEIVATMHRLAEGTLRPTLEALTPDDLNTRHTRSQLWSIYKRPELERLLYPIQQAAVAEKDYFFGNVSFIAREMRIGKTGGGADATRGGFADTWNLSLKEKEDNGNILSGLRIKELIEEDGVSAIIFTRPECGDDFFPNFRAGDTIFIYTSDSEDTCATNRHVSRGTLTSISAKEITFKLRHRQRNPYIFPLDSLYAAEHDHLDSTARTSFREMNAMLLAPKSRRELILAERRPTFDSSRTLNGDYHNEHINNIVLKAKQANELFLLVGPPGTGKTSKALSSMVQEFYADKDSNILLASFTNRAVDEICEALEKLPQKPDYIRIGNEHACAPQYTHRLLKNVISDCGRREDISKKLLSTHITVGTISSLSGRQELFELKKFDVAIIDEASQILESQIVGLLAATAP
ncbi:MAG: AAA family ATPase, partial [Bacteroidaceae bacterium]|nr:AAA family ATPase [Bacteroidaceae bacterium]